MTTLGKLRHLQRASTNAGHFVILAIDHRENLREKLNAAAGHHIDDAGLSQFKMQVVGPLVTHASAVLIDPAFGIAPGIAQNVINGHKGLLAPLEVTDYGLHPSQREMQMMPGWSVEKIKRVGGDGVKLLLPYHPEAKNTRDKHTFVEQVVEQCAKYDLPFFLEPIAYSLDPSAKLSNAELRQVVVGMAKTFSEMGVDILKMQFPVDAAQGDDEAEWRAACEDLNAACTVPWALLSAGVNYVTYARQAKIACAAGASGVIVGRAVWAEAVEAQGDARTAFVHETGIARMIELGQICRDHATPWTERVKRETPATDWYESF